MILLTCHGRFSVEPLGNSEALSGKSVLTGFPLNLTVEKLEGKTGVVVECPQVKNNVFINKCLCGSTAGSFIWGKRVCWSKNRVYHRFLPAEVMALMCYISTDMSKPQSGYHVGTKLGRIVP